jgi:hypothetical protein
MTEFTDSELVESLTAAITDECIKFFEQGFHPAIPIDDQVVMNALARALCFGLVETHKTDEAAMETINRVMPMALAQEREFAQTLPTSRPKPNLQLIRTELSDETKAQMKEIDDNIRNANINADSIIAGLPQS